MNKNIWCLRNVFSQCLYELYISQICIGFYLAGIKKYIVGLIIRTSSDASALEREKVYLGKLNMILVQVW